MKKLLAMLLLLTCVGCHKSHHHDIAPSQNNQTDEQYCAENPERCVPQVNPGV